jgi:hypothetical protein
MDTVPSESAFGTKRQMNVIRHDHRCQELKQNAASSHAGIEHELANVLR